MNIKIVKAVLSAILPAIAFGIFQYYEIGDVAKKGEETPQTSQATSLEGEKLASIDSQGSVVVEGSPGARVEGVYIDYRPNSETVEIHPGGELEIKNPIINQPETQIQNTCYNNGEGKQVCSTGDIQGGFHM